MLNSIMVECWKQECYHLIHSVYRLERLGMEGYAMICPRCEVQGVRRKMIEHNNHYVCLHCYCVVMKNGGKR